MDRRVLLIGVLLSCQAQESSSDGEASQPSSVVSGPVSSGGPGVATEVSSRAQSSSSPPPAMAPGEQPPILLVTLDTTRADHLGFYGYFRDTSPNLDHLASMSLVFDDAIAPMATTLPTHLSLMTGLTPLEHGTTANVVHGGTRFVPGDGVQTVAQLLSAAGYQTAAFVSAAPLEAGTGVERGFAVFNAPEGIERAGDKTVNRAVRWLQRVDLSRPWFLWVHLYDPHNPYWPMEPWKSQFVGQGDQSGWLEERQFPERSTRPGPVEPGRATGEVVETVPANDRYDGEIAFMDAQVGRLMLEVARTKAKPIILVVGDHGEGLGQHDQPGHGRVWNEQLRVPMLLHAPGLAPGRHASTVGVIDAIPTLLGRLQVQGAEAFMEQASGMDVLREGAEARVVYSLQSQRQVEEFGASPTSALTATDWKLVVVEGQGAALYDRQADPHELNPRDGRVRVVQLNTLRDLQLKRAAELDSPTENEISDESREALKALGYLDE